MQKLVILKIERLVRQDIVPQFCSYFSSESKTEGFTKFHKAVDRLYTSFSTLISIAVILNDLRNSNKSIELVYGQMDAVVAIKLILRSTLLSQLPLNHERIIRDCYETALQMEDSNGYLQSERLCTLCGREGLNCRCLDCFYETNRYFFDFVEWC